MSGGGGILDRSRFLMRIIEDVRGKVPEDFIIGVRISPSTGRSVSGYMIAWSWGKCLLRRAWTSCIFPVGICSWGSSEFTDDERTLTQWFSETLDNAVPHHFCRGDLVYRSGEIGYGPRR